jgi:hypothetical protein
VRFIKIRKLIDAEHLVATQVIVMKSTHQTEEAVDLSRTGALIKKITAYRHEHETTI